MVEAPGGARFAQETLAHFRHDFGRQIVEQRLDGDFALDQRIDRAVHRSHRAAAELADDTVAP